MLFVLFAGNTLGRLGRVVGNFFGVTEASQHGTAGNIGWEEWTEQRVNEVRSPSLPPSLPLSFTCLLMHCPITCLLMHCQITCVSNLCF